MKFNRGAELDKQIYKEGEFTWGCKSGVLDVEDVKNFIKECENQILKKGRRFNIYELAGSALI